MIVKFLQVVVRLADKVIFGEISVGTYMNAMYKVYS